MSLMDTILRRKPVEAVEMVTLANHEEVTAFYRGRVISLTDERDAETKRANGLAAQITMADNQTRAAYAECDSLRNDVRAAEQAYEGVLRDKIATDGRASAWKDSAFKAASALEEYKADALKYRERCKRDREAAAAKRKAKGGEG